MAGETGDNWLRRDPLPGDPMPWLARWLDEAFAAGLERNPHAMTLATVDPAGRPEARVVLCRGVDVAAGSLRFFSHYESRKGRALDAAPRAALVFYWGPQERQARVEGAVERLPESESDAYFAARPLEARIGAWASAQSRPIASRAALEARVAETARALGVGPEGERRPIPRPPHWGGYRVLAERVELWRSRPARLHDRVCWSRQGESGPGGWRVERLQP